MSTPRQSMRPVYRRMTLALLSHALIVSAFAIAAARRAGPVLVVVLLGSTFAATLAMIRFWLWCREAPGRRTAAAGQPASWLATAPPGLAALLGAAGHERQRDRMVQGRLSYADGVLAWRPTRARTGLGCPIELRWDPTWRRRMTRPFLLWLYGGGQLTLSHPGSDDAILWIMNAGGFRRTTRTRT